MMTIDRLDVAPPASMVTSTALEAVELLSIP